MNALVLRDLQAQEPILKNKIRILRPGEYDALKRGAESLANQTKLDALLLTGMRYIEMQRLHYNPNYFQRNNRVIHLPQEAQRKEKRTAPDRYIKLTPEAMTVIPYFLQGEGLPSARGWNLNLRVWASRGGLDTEGISAKTTRKTWESWLYSAYPGKIEIICLSQGHDTLTSMRHYASLPFSDADKLEIARRVEGWL